MSNTKIVIFDKRDHLLHTLSARRYSTGVDIVRRYSTEVDSTGVDIARRYSTRVDIARRYSSEVDNTGVDTVQK